MASPYQSITSLVPCPTTGMVWGLDEQSKTILLLDKNGRIKSAAQLDDNGVLVTNDSGTLFVSYSGKRYIIQQETTGIPQWRIYNN